MNDTKVRVKLNSSGIRALLKSQMMMDGIMDQAASQGEIDATYVGFDRVQVVVKKQEGESNAD